MDQYNETKYKELKKKYAILLKVSLTLQLVISNDLIGIP
jgi:hypothetical protein